MPLTESGDGVHGRNNMVYLSSVHIICSFYLFILLAIDRFTCTSSTGALTLSEEVTTDR